VYVESGTILSGHFTRELGQDAYDDKACNWLKVPWLFVYKWLADVCDVLLSMVIA